MNCSQLGQCVNLYLGKWENKFYEKILHMFMGILNTGRRPPRVTLSDLLKHYLLIATCLSLL